jgi:PAS domain-containing protein
LLYGYPMLEQRAHRTNDFEQLGRIFEHAPGFMAVVEGPDLRFAVANQAFRKLVGRSDLIGKTLTGALPTPRCRT